MSDQAAPRKIGSLRDRIAAFESQKDKEASAPLPPSAPRKSGQLKWQPRERSPPSAPAQADVVSEGGEHGGMSANDAAESIGKMSLKERMAALQGRGGFGAPAPAPPPIQKSDKPKWKPPPRPVEAPTSASEHEGDEEGASERASVRSPIKSPMSGLSELEGDDGVLGGAGRRASGHREEKEEVGVEEDEDEEEARKRRAAIAARMARLGGARLGMAPPVYSSTKTRQGLLFSVRKIEVSLIDMM